jgi:hypothetical protein
MEPDKAILGKITFTSRCPNGHEAVMEFEREVLREAFAAGHLSLFCSQCQTFWNAESEERKKLAEIPDSE